MNHRTTAAALASCALAVAVLTACGSGEPAAAHSQRAGPATPAPAGTTATAGAHSAPAATPTAGAGTSPSPAQPAAGGATAHPSGTDQQAKKAGGALPPRPDANGEAAYVRALTAIDPDIVHDKEDEAVDRGRDQCATIHDHPGDREKQIAAAMRRFTSPGHPDGFGRAKSTRITDAVHTHLCPGY